MNKTLYLKRTRLNPDYEYPQALNCELTNWTENDLAQLNYALTVFKKGSEGEFDFYIGEYGILGKGIEYSDVPDGFFPAVDEYRKAKKDEK